MEIPLRAKRARRKIGIFCQKMRNWPLHMVAFAAHKILKMLASEASRKNTHF